MTASTPACLPKSDVYKRQERALADLLKREGMTEVPEGELVSLLDRLSALPPGARIIELSKYRSDLLSAVDRVWLAQLQEQEKRIGHSLDPGDIEKFYEEYWAAWE